MGHTIRVPSINTGIREGEIRNKVGTGRLMTCGR